MLIWKNSYLSNVNIVLREYEYGSVSIVIGCDGLVQSHNLIVLVLVLYVLFSLYFLGADVSALRLSVRQSTILCSCCLCHSVLI